ncbi:MAG: hypothetical protein HKN85_11515 [Gammaproteobacteria bacterium]|nr:hypothetical protein [Gammaproteobacteria bacterium]
MNIKKFALGGIAASMLSTGGLANAGEISANVTLASDYVFRGFSQTNEELAIQGGLDYAFENGLYLGTWASNVNFGGETSSENDFYIGYGFDLNDDVALDFSAIYFAYPGDDDALNYSEFTAGVSFGDFGFGLVFSPDYFGSDSSAYILNADYSFGLAENFSLDLHAGYTKTDDAGIATTEDNYIDYSVGVGTTAVGADFALTFYGTDVDDNDLADDRLVLSVGKAF